MSITEERKKEVDFSNEYITSRQIVIVNNNSSIESINEINNKIVAVQLGSVADSYVTKNKITDNIVRQKKYLSMIEDLKANKVDLIIMDELPAKEILKNNSELKILEGYIFEDSYAVAVKKGNTELLNQINEVINELKQNGKIDEYIIRYSK